MQTPMPQAKKNVNKNKDPKKISRKYGLPLLNLDREHVCSPVFLFSVKRGCDIEILIKPLFE